MSKGKKRVKIGHKLSETAFFINTIVRYLKYIWSKHPLALSLLLLFTVLETIFPVGVAYINAKLFDLLIGLGATAVQGQAVQNAASFLKELPSALLILLAYYIVLLAFSSIVSRISSMLKFRIRKSLDIEVEVDVAEKISSLDMVNLDDPMVNDLINKVTTKSMTASFSSFNNFLIIISLITGVILHSAILFSLAPTLILVVIILSLPESIAYAHYSKKILSVWNSQTEQRRDAIATASYLYSAQNLKEIRLFSSVKYFIDRFKNLMWESTLPHIEADKKRGIVDILFSTVSSLGYGLILLVLFFFVLLGRITVGTFTFYVNSVNMLQDTMKKLFGSFARMYEDSAHTKYLFDLFDLKNSVITGKNLVNSKNIPSIEFKNVSFKYPGSKNYVLQNFNLVINPEEHLAVVGVNGAGKTTLIKLLLRFYDVDEGEILIDGKNIKEIDLSFWYDKISALFQDYNFYHFDAQTNIGLGDVKNIDDLSKIEDAAKLAGADEFIEKYENKYKQVLKKTFSGGLDPSIGQKQRIAFARVFFSDNPIIILDEPTSAIDPRGEYEIFQRLFKHCKNKTVITISHRFSTVKNAGRIIVLDKGKVVEDGSHEELISIKNGKYKSSYELQKEFL